MEWKDGNVLRAFLVSSHIHHVILEGPMVLRLPFVWLLQIHPKLCEVWGPTRSPLQEIKTVRSSGPPWYSLITVRNIDINKHFHLVSCHHQPPLHPQPPPPVSIRRIKPAEIQDSHFLQTCWINTHTHAQQPFHTSWMGCRCPDCTAGAWELLSRGFPLLWAWQQWVRCDPAPTSCMWGVCMHWAKSGCWFPGWEKPLPWWWGLLSETCLVWDFRKKADSDLWGLKLIQFRGSLKEKEYQVMHTKQDWKSVFIYYRMRKEI